MATIVAFTLFIVWDRALVMTSKELAMKRHFGKEEE